MPRERAGWLVAVFVGAALLAVAGMHFRSLGRMKDLAADYECLAQRGQAHQGSIVRIASPIDSGVTSTKTRMIAVTVAFEADEAKHVLRERWSPYWAARHRMGEAIEVRYCGENRLLKAASIGDPAIQVRLSAAKDKAQ